MEALVFAAAYTGLRWGELAGLRRCDVDLERNLVTVTRKLGEVNGQLSFSPPKTAAGKRTIGIPSFVARSLAVHIDLYALPGGEGLVFPSADGLPMRRSNFRRRVWEPAITEVGMVGFRFHDLRHTAATLAAASGTSLKALMARIGHSSAAAALRYQHVIDGQDADIVKYLERFGNEPPVPARAHDDTQEPVRGGHVVGTTSDPAGFADEQQASDQDFRGGDDGTRTHDPLLAKQVTAVGVVALVRARKSWSERRLGYRPIPSYVRPLPCSRGVFAESAPDPHRVLIRFMVDTAAPVRG